MKQGWNRQRRLHARWLATHFRYPPRSIISGLDEAAQALRERLAGCRSESKGQLGAENIVAVGVGPKVIGGVRYPVLCVKVLVVRKAVPRRLEAGCEVGPTVNGYLTDVEEVGESLATFARAIREHQKRHRPAPGGVCIGPRRASLAGTSGCLVKRQGRPCILTVEHILGRCGEPLPEGEEILQPGKSEVNPSGGEVIASVMCSSKARYYPTRREALNAPASSDWALAEAHPQDVTPEVLRIGRVTSVADMARLSVGCPVVKSGRGSGRTIGKLMAFNMVGAIGYRDGVWIHLSNFALIGRRGWMSPFAREGDSGALALTEGDNKALGLIVARTAKGDAYIIPLSRVLEESGAQIITDHGAMKPPYMGGSS